MYSIYRRYGNKRIAPQKAPWQWGEHLGVQADTYWQNVIPRSLAAMLWVKVSRNKNPVTTDYSERESGSSLSPQKENETARCGRMDGVRRDRERSRRRRVTWTHWTCVSLKLWISADCRVSVIFSKLVEFRQQRAEHHSSYCVGQRHGGKRGDTDSPFPPNKLWFLYWFRSRFLVLSRGVVLNNVSLLTYFFSQVPPDQCKTFLAAPPLLNSNLVTEKKLKCYVSNVYSSSLNSGTPDWKKMLRTRPQNM